MEFNLPNGDKVGVNFQVDDMDMLEQILRTLEARMDEVGWDEPPTFLTVNRDAHAAEAGAEILETKEITWLPHAMYLDPGPGLIALARAMVASDTAKALLPQLAAKFVGNDFYGLIAFTEAWMSAGVGTAPVLGPNYEWSGVMPRDDPNRLEIRSGIMVTVDGRVLMIVRVRGEIPEFHELGQGDGPIETGGRVVDALRMLVTTFHDALQAA